MPPRKRRRVNPSPSPEANKEDDIFAIQSSDSEPSNQGYKDSWQLGRQVLSLVDAKIAKSSVKHIDTFTKYTDEQQTRLKDMVDQRLQKIRTSHENRKRGIGELTAAAKNTWGDEKMRRYPLPRPVAPIGDVDATLVEDDNCTDDEYTTSKDFDYPTRITACVEHAKSLSANVLSAYSNLCEAFEAARQEIGAQLSYDEDIAKVARSLEAGKSDALSKVQNLVGVDDDELQDYLNEYLPLSEELDIKKKKSKKKNSKRRRKELADEDKPTEHEQIVWTEEDKERWQVALTTVVSEGDEDFDLDMLGDTVAKRSMHEDSRRLIKYSRRMVKKFNGRNES